MKHKKSISISVLFTLVLLAVAGSGCAKSCPKEGTYVTGDAEGMTKFEVKNCGIPFLYYTITFSGNQTSGKIGLLDTCRIDNQQFTCREQGYADPRWTFTGKFSENNTAEGQLIFNKGSQWDWGKVTEAIIFDWQASLP